MSIETHAMNFQFVFDSFRAGDNDYLTYVDKILLVTHQKSEILERLQLDFLRLH